MAGKSQRFFDAGYTVPKALLPLGHTSMIHAVLWNLRCENADYTIIINTNQITKDQLCLLDVNVIEIDYVPSGPACSALLAREYVNNDIPLIVTNCDQIIEDLDMELFLSYCETNNLDGCLGTFHSTSPKNSYVRVNEKNEIIELREKQVISNTATNGFHYWKSGSLFVKSTEELISSGKTVNGEYFVSETFNNLIADGKKLMPFQFNLHFPIGTPQDYESYKTLRNL